MAEAMRNWRTWCAVAALSLGACGMVCAQTVAADPAPLQGIQIQTPGSGSLAGRLTDLHSAPLAGVAVVLHNQATGAEVRAVTGKNGGFRFAGLEAGEYSLEADEPQLGHGRLEGILVTGGMEARVQAAMQFEAAAPEFHPTALSSAATPGEDACRLPHGRGDAAGGIGSSRMRRQSAVAKLLMLAAPPAAVSRAALNTETPQMTAMVDAEPMRSMTTAPRAADAVRPPSETVAPRPVMPQPPVRAGGIDAARWTARIASCRNCGPRWKRNPLPRSLRLRSRCRARSRSARRGAGTACPNMAIASGMKAVLLLGQMAVCAGCSRRAKGRSGHGGRGHHGDRERTAVAARERTPLAGISARHSRSQRRCRLDAGHRSADRRNRRRSRSTARARALASAWPRAPVRRLAIPAGQERGPAERDEPDLDRRARIRRERGRDPRGNNGLRQRGGRGNALRRRAHQPSRPRAAATRCTARASSSTARTTGARATPSRSGSRRLHRPRSPMIHPDHRSPCRFSITVRPDRRNRIRRPITRWCGASAWAAASAATSCSGLPRSTATTATIRAWRW